MSSRKPNGNKRKIQFSEENGDDEVPDVATAVSASTGSRRDKQREVAQRRAAHFARADPAPLSGTGTLQRRSHTPVSSTPTGFLRRSTVPGSAAGVEADESADLEAWPGPFSTARDMIAKRDEAKKLRDEAIAAKAAGGNEYAEDDDLLDDYDKALKNLEWPSAAATNLGVSSLSKFLNRGPIPSLTSLCAGLLAAHFDKIEGKELGYLQMEEREKVATQLAKLRKCDAEAVLKLAVEGSQCLILPECSEVDEDTLVRALEQAAGVAAVRQLEPEEDDEAAPAKGKKPAAVKGAKGKKKAVEVEVVAQAAEPSEAALRVLKLRNCGRGMVDRSAAACINLTQGCLEVLQLTGCYRLNDLALVGLLSANRTTLLSLDLSCNSRVGAQALRCIRSLTNLQELTLDNCTHLGDEALLHLLTDTPSSVAPSLLADPNSATVAQVSQNSSSSSSALEAPLLSLLSLSLVGLIELTDVSVVPLMRAFGPQLQHLALSGCVLLTDLSIHSIRQYCGHLNTLSLAQLGEVSTAAMVGLFVAHPAVLSARTGQFTHHAPPQAQRATSSTSATSHSSSASSSSSEKFSSNGVAADDFEGFEAPPSIGRLEEVILQGTVSVTDDVIITLCESNRRTLRVLDLSGCHQLTSRAGIALRMHARNSLEILDLSFVRGVSQEVLGSLVDACAEDGAALQKLTLWGCTQLSEKFFQGHKKHDLEVVGRMTA